jgi:hypothetical protein
MEPTKDEAGKVRQFANDNKIPDEAAWMIWRLSRGKKNPQKYRERFVIELKKNARKNDLHQPPNPET